MENRRSIYKITGLHGVYTPGYYYVYDNQATIFEGLGLAGDPTIFASRNNVKLTRSATWGLEVVRLDLKEPKTAKIKVFLFYAERCIECRAPQSPFQVFKS